MKIKPFLMSLFVMLIIWAGTPVYAEEDTSQSKNLTISIPFQLSNHSYPEIWLSTNRIILDLHSKFDPLSYVETIYGGMTSPSLKVSDPVNTNETGKYIVSYTVTDDRNRSTMQTLTVIVVENEFQRGARLFEEKLNDLLNKKITMRTVDSLLSELDEMNENVRKELNLTLVEDLIAKLEEKVNWVPEEDRMYWPLPDNFYISSYFGPRWGTTHGGIDIPAARGTKIHACADGVVEIAGWYGGYGYCVSIRHPNGYVTRYGHQSEVLVEVGDHVSRGDVIGLVGSTGYSTGNHLHLEVLLDGNHLNPLDYVIIE